MVLFYSNEMVKCSWSDSQSSSGDAVYAADEDGRWDERQTRFSVCSKKNACLSNSFIHTETRRTWIIHIWIDFCSLIFTDTSPCRDLMCKDLLLINSSKLRQIPWHSVLNCKYVFFITGFRDSIRVFCIAEIIGPYTSRTGMTGYSVPKVLKKIWYCNIFIFFVPTWYRSTGSFDNTS